MRNGYILLHRKGITEQDWKHPGRTLAWIDLCTLAAYADYRAPDGVLIRQGEVIASYSYLANRWKVSKSTAYEWMAYFIAERQIERRSERCDERNAERFFLVNYAKYQMLAERSAEREVGRMAERTSELIKLILRIPTTKVRYKKGSATRRVARPLQHNLEALAIFTICMKPAFDNAEQLAAWVKRYLRASTDLTAFTPRQVATACVYARFERDEYTKKHGRGYDVHLETVAKKIFEHKDDEPGGHYQHAIDIVVDYYEKNKNAILSKTSPYLKPQ